LEARSACFAPPLEFFGLVLILVRQIIFLSFCEGRGFVVSKVVDRFTSKKIAHSELEQLSSLCFLPLPLFHESFGVFEIMYLY
jgi:hypothetical protein